MRLPVHAAERCGRTSFTFQAQLRPILCMNNCSYSCRPRGIFVLCEAVCQMINDQWILLYIYIYLSISLSTNAYIHTHRYIYIYIHNTRGLFRHSHFLACPSVHFLCICSLVWNRVTLRKEVVCKGKENCLRKGDC